MKKTNSIKRRSFLKSVPAALGVAALLKQTNGEARGGEKADRPVAPLRETAAIKRSIAAVERKLPDFLNVAPEEGRFLSLLVKISRAQNVLELGTTVGYSALWLGLGLVETGGKLITLELLPERQDLAKEFLKQAGLTDRVTCRQGDAHQIVPTLAGPFDLVFHDADKGGTVDYFDKLYPKLLAPGSLLVVHNAATQAASLEEYSAMIRKQPNFETSTLSAVEDDAFLVSYRQR